MGVLRVFQQAAANMHLKELKTEKKKKVLEMQTEHCMHAFTTNSAGKSGHGGVQSCIPATKSAPQKQVRGSSFEKSSSQSYTCWIWSIQFC